MAYLKIARPSYTAAAVIEIANREGRFLQQQATLADLPDDIERDIMLAKSWSVAELVAQKLHLADDVEFDPPASDLLLRLHSLWSGADVDPDVVARAHDDHVRHEQDARDPRHFRHFLRDRLYER